MKCDRITAVGNFTVLPQQSAEHQLLRGGIGHANAAFGAEYRIHCFNRTFARHPDQTDRPACGRDGGNRIVHRSLLFVIRSGYDSCYPVQ